VSGVSQVLCEVEAVGIILRLDGEKVRISYPDEERREELAERIAFLRDHKDEVAEFLRARAVIPPMPPGIRLVKWDIKEAPVAISYYAVVTDPTLFVSTTLGQLKAALENPKRWVGWTVPQLLDRLRQVGVDVALD
jgi:hypothetical protein